MQPITHISDTSYWIAAFRAEETARANPAFKDAFAAKLAGEKGMQIMRDTPYNKIMAFAITMRTTAIDSLVEAAIADGVDTVINLGARLDSRPYRMQLPPALKWIEVDFEAVIDYKTEILKNDKPVCTLTRIATDLADEAERKKLFAKLGSQTNKALLITEGVITYLTNDEAARLSADIHAVPTFKYWIQNYRRGRMRNTRTRALANKMTNTSILTFTAKDAFKFFAQQGWAVKKNIGLLEEGAKFGRRLPAMFPWNILLALSPMVRKIANKTFGCVMFEREREG